MTMGFKYQLVSCKFPEELIGVTFNHVDSVRKMVEEPTTIQLLDAFWKRFNEVREVYLNINSG